jgi:hypothetical protein
MIGFAQNITKGDVYNVFATASHNSLISGSPYNVFIADKYFQHPYTASGTIVENNGGIVKYIGGISGSMDLQNTSSWLPLGTLTLYSGGTYYPPMSQVVASSGIFITLNGTSNPLFDNTGALTSDWIQTPYQAINRLRANIGQYITNKINQNSKYNWLQSVSGDLTWDSQSGFPIGFPSIYYDNQWFYFAAASSYVSVTSRVRSQIYPYVGQLQTCSVVNTRPVWAVYPYLGNTNDYPFTGQFTNTASFSIVVGGNMPLSCSTTMSVPLSFIIGNTVTQISASADFSSGLPYSWGSSLPNVNGSTQTSVLDTPNVNDYVRVVTPFSCSVSFPPTNSWGGFNQIYPYLSCNIAFNTVLTNSIYTFNVYTRVDNDSPPTIVDSYGGFQTVQYHVGTKVGTFGTALYSIFTSTVTNKSASLTKGIHNRKSISKIAFPKISTDTRYPALCAFTGSRYYLPIVSSTGLDDTLPYTAPLAVQCLISQNSASQLYYSGIDYKQISDNIDFPFQPPYTITTGTTGSWFGMIPPINKLSYANMSTMPNNVMVTVDGQLLSINYRTPPLSSSIPFRYDYSTYTWYHAYNNTEEEGAVPPWKQYTWYPYGFLITDSNGNIQQCVSSSVSNGIQPNWSSNTSSYTTESKDSTFNDGGNNHWAASTTLIWQKIYDRTNDMVAHSSGIFYNPTPATIYHVPLYPAISDYQTRNTSSNYVIGQQIRDTNGEIRICYRAGKTSTGSVSWGSGAGNVYGNGMIGASNYINDGTVTWYPYLAGFAQIGNWIYKIYPERCNGNTGSINVDVGYYITGSYTSLGQFPSGKWSDCMYPIFTNTPLVYRCSEPIRLEASLITNQSGSWGFIGSPISAIYLEDILNILPIII